MFYMFMIYCNFLSIHIWYMYMVPMLNKSVLYRLKYVSIYLCTVVFYKIC